MIQEFTYEQLSRKYYTLLKENEKLKKENEELKKQAADVERVIKYLNNLLPNK